MIMAACASHRHPQKRGGRRFDTVDDIFAEILLGDRPAFEIDHVVAIEPGSDLLVIGG